MIKNAFRLCSASRVPILYKTMIRLITGVGIVLLWSRFSNGYPHRLTADDLFLFLSISCFAGAWFNYLKLDGMGFYRLDNGRKRKRKKHPGTTMIDCIEEDTGPGHAISEKEAAVMAIGANVLCGVLFLLPPFISFLL